MWLQTIAMAAMISNLKVFSEESERWTEGKTVALVWQNLQKLKVQGKHLDVETFVTSVFRRKSMLHGQG